MKMKRILMLSLILVLMFSVVGIAKTTIVNIASTYPPNSPVDKGLVKFKELVAERSDGRIEIMIHPSEAMGDERQTFEMLSQGSVEYGALGAGDISYYYPKYYVMEVPYVFSDEDDFWKFWQGPGKELSAMIEKERGVRTDGIILRGAEYLTANQPIKSVADVEGLKLRMYPVKSCIKAWESIGANITQIAFSEVYMALKTGVVDAQVNPPETILNYKFYEAQKYLIATKHIYSSARILSSVEWWNTLNKEDQTLLTEAMDECVAYMNSLTKDADAVFVKELEELGMTLIEVDIDAFSKAMKPAIEQWAKDEWDTAFYAKVQEALK